jgi:hypothetical protein
VLEFKKKVNTFKQEKTMSRTNFDQLLQAGCHFGHLKRKWNPAMAPYIFMERNGISHHRPEQNGSQNRRGRRSIEIYCQEWQEDFVRRY